MDKILRLQSWNYIWSDTLIFLEEEVFRFPFKRLFPSSLVSNFQCVCINYETGLATTRENKLQEGHFQASYLEFKVNFVKVNISWITLSKRHIFVNQVKVKKKHNVNAKQSVNFGSSNNLKLYFKIGFNFWLDLSEPLDFATLWLALLQNSAFVDKISTLYFNYLLKMSTLFWNLKLKKRNLLNISCGPHPLH